MKLAVLIAAAAAIHVQSGGRDWIVEPQPLPAMDGLVLPWDGKMPFPTAAEAIGAAQVYLDTLHKGCVTTGQTATTRTPGYWVEINCPDSQTNSN